MRDYLFVFEIVIPASYDSKKRSLTKVSTLCHLFSLVAICQFLLLLSQIFFNRHSLCRSDSAVFLSAILGKYPKIRRRHLHVLYKMHALKKLKMFYENLRILSQQLQPDTLIQRNSIRVLLKPPTTNPPTYRPLTTDPQTQQPLTHQPTEWLSSIYIKIETRF